MHLHYSRRRKVSKIGQRKWSTVTEKIGREAAGLLTVRRGLMPVAPIFGRKNALPESSSDMIHIEAEQVMDRLDTAGNFLPCRRLFVGPLIDRWRDPIFVGRSAGIPRLAFFDSF